MGQKKGQGRCDCVSSAEGGEENTVPQRARVCDYYPTVMMRERVQWREEGWARELGPLRGHIFSHGLMLGMRHSKASCLPGRLGTCVATQQGREGVLC